MKMTFLSTLILASILLTACSGTATPAPTAQPAAAAAPLGSVSAEGTLLPEPSVELAFAQGGVVKEVLASPGKKLAAGDVIARLVGIETVQAELAAAELEQALARQSLDALNRNALLTASQAEQALLDAQKAYEREANRWHLGNTDDATDLELSLDDYVASEEDARDAREKLDDLLDHASDDRKRLDAQADYDTEKQALVSSYADLLDEVAKNTQSLDKERIDLLRAIGALEAARQLQSRLDDASLDPELLAIAQARLGAAQAHAAAAQAAVELYELRAPISGTLLSLDLEAGEAVTPLLPVAFLGDPSHWNVESRDLAEIDVAAVAVGDPVSIKLDAFPGEVFPGTVKKIDPVGREYLGDMTYKVTIALDEPDPRFLWNMTATVTIGGGTE